MNSEKEQDLLTRQYEFSTILGVDPSLIRTLEFCKSCGVDLYEIQIAP